MTIEMLIEQVVKGRAPISVLEIALAGMRLAEESKLDHEAISKVEKVLETVTRD